MKTYILEGIVEALTSICHNGGEKNGIVSQLRREKFVQQNGSVEDVPVISGNSIRGILRDIGMKAMLQNLGYGITDDGQVNGLPLNAFYFLFSGGALVSTGDGKLDVDYFRKMKTTIPLIGLFGGAAGNSILPGKIKIGKLIPICDETKHLVPPRFLPENICSIWDYCQTEMYTRKDDEKNDKVRGMLASVQQKQLQTAETISTIATPPAEAKAAPQQMMYHTETLAAGTKFFWRVVLEDVTDVEFEAFLATVIEFSKTPHIGGKSAVGHGEISIKMEQWIEIDSRTNLKGTELDLKLGTKYMNHLRDNKDAIKSFLHAMDKEPKEAKAKKTKNDEE